MANIPRPPVEGIDVAHYQYVTDEDAIPHLPVMTCKASEGANYKDPTRPNWIRIFKERAEVIGMYHWIRSDAPLLAQVENLADCYREEGVLPRDGELAPGWIVQLDWERTYKMVNGVRTLVRDMTVAEVEMWHGYADRVFGPGRIVTYGSDWVPNFTTWRQRNPDKPVWYANYSLSDLPSGGQQESAKFNACLWQWSSQVMVPGIDTRSRPGIDVSQVLNMAQVRAAAHLMPPIPPAPQPPQETDMPAFISNKTAGKYGAAPSPQGGCTIWEMVHNTKKALSFEAWIAYGQPYGIALEDAVLDGLPDYTESSGTVDDIARADAMAAMEASIRNANSISDIRMGGQRIADAGGR